MKRPIASGPPGVLTASLLLIFAITWVFPAPVLAGDKAVVGQELRLDLRVDDQEGLPIGSDQEEMTDSTLSKPVYENPWFWVAIVITSCAAGVSIYLLSQQQSSATLTLPP